MKLMESKIVDNYTTMASEVYNFDVTASEFKDIAEVAMSATSDFLSILKSKTTKTALAIKDLKGNLIIAAIVEFNENEDGKEEELPGNWNYYYTFDKDDLEGANVYDLTDTQVIKVFNNRAFESYHMRFADIVYVSQLCTLFYKLLDECLEENAKDEEFTIEHEGYFVASSAVEDGKKVKSFVPDGAMKTIIKSDVAIEV